MSVAVLGGAGRGSLDVSGNPVIATGSGDSRRISIGILRRTNEDCCARTALTGPDVTQNPLRELTNQIKREPDCAASRDHRQHQLREKTTRDTTRPRQQHDTPNSEEQAQRQIQRAVATVAARGEYGGDDEEADNDEPRPTLDERCPRVGDRAAYSTVRERNCHGPSE